MDITLMALSNVYLPLDMKQTGNVTLRIVGSDQTVKLKSFIFVNHCHEMRCSYIQKKEIAGIKSKRNLGGIIPLFEPYTASITYVIIVWNFLYSKLRNPVVSFKISSGCVC